jgi:phosphoheptose isomerase/ADP-heptose:LPS heptosyltransferase
MPMSHAVVARLDSAGDVLITGPAVRAIAAAHDWVTFLAGPRGREAAELLPAVDEVIEWQAPWVDFDSPELTAGHVESLVKQLRDVRPDRVFVFTSFHQSPLPLALLCRMAGVPWIGAICEDYPGTLLDLRHHVPDGIPEPERAVSLARAGGFGLPSGDEGALRIGALPPLPEELTALIGAAPFVVFHPGAAVPARRPTAARSAAMVTALVDAGHRVLVTGAPDERELTAAAAGDAAVDLGGRTTLATLAAVYAAARVVVVPNTGPAHLAAAVGAPVVSLFAPVVPASQWMPHGRRVIRLGDQGAPCRQTRARECPVAGHPCLDGRIGPEVSRLTTWGGHLAEVLASGGRLLACGNGGSAAEAQHLTAELVGRFRDERMPLSAIALHADTSALTAIGNDYGIDEVFARGVRAHGRTGDVLISLSTSGTSQNVLTAVKAAHEGGLTTWALTGPAPNPLAAMCDDAVCVEAGSTATVQEIHLLLVHALCIAVDDVLLGDGGPRA